MCSDGGLDFESPFHVAVTAYSADISSSQEWLQLIKCRDEGLLDSQSLFQVAVIAGSAYTGNFWTAVINQLLDS